MNPIKYNKMINVIKAYLAEYIIFHLLSPHCATPAFPPRVVGMEQRRVILRRGEGLSRNVTT